MSRGRLALIPGVHSIMERSTGQCAMQGTCGRKGWIGQPLPCPYNGPPTKPDTEEFKLLISSVCGPLFEDVPVCCTSEQVETLQDSLVQAEGLISPCPACRNNFRSFYCHFTCSSDQGTFLNVSATQQTSEGLEAVKSVDFFVGEPFGDSFFDSCKNVKYGASNGFAMDLIGGGAKDYRSFLKFMGDEKPLGSPFQINYPESAPPEYTMFNPLARGCSDSDPSSHCSCTDCPTSCPALPYIPPPDSQPSCRVGSVTCLSFILLSTYLLAVFAVIVGYFVNILVQRRREKTYEGVALSGDPPPLSPSTITRGLVGASSLAQVLDGEDSSVGQSDSRHLGRGASLLDPIDTFQPRRYHLNIFLRRIFYRIGAACANYPWLTIAISFIIVGLCNIGWKRFGVETDPVRLWVGPASESKLQKEYFDEHFGPFYRAEQIFVISSDEISHESDTTDPVLTWDRLKWWFEVEKDIRSLISEPNGYTLEDVCFKPAGPEGSCVVQSITGWFGNSLENYNSTSWAQRVKSCSSQPVNCLPDFQQPLMPAYILGGAPGDEQKNWLESRSLIVTLVVDNSLDDDLKEKAEEWERTLRAFLEQLSAVSVDAASSKILFSTGVSLEEEINKSTNTDIRIVVLSYFFMFLYVAIALGNGDAYRKSTGNVFKQSAISFIRIFRRKTLDTSTIESREDRSPSLSRRLFVGSKFTLGIFGIFLVILSVSTSVGLFSTIGVKVTLIIAEVIPFLILAVGVDNVFILVHELDRQNLMHGPSASNNLGPSIFSPVSPIRHLSFESTHDDHVDTDSMPLHLSPEERVARTVAKMGPSILLSSITETLAFALGALVPMPAVRNFALYAAGSVLINAILQMTTFVGALTIDLRRTESGRVDCFPCITLPSRIALADTSSGVGLSRTALFMRRHYAPYLMRPVVKGGVLTLFAGIFIGSIISIQHIQLGLDQRLALPAESYLIPYFDAVDMYLDVGPPVYFVSQDVNVTSIIEQRHLCGRFTTCDEMSLANVLEVERIRPESSFISQPAASWIDDFLRWLDPGIDTCCRVRRRDPEQFCGPDDPSSLCKPCFQDRKPEWNITLFGMPEGDEFMKYLQQWLISPTDEDCPLGGRAAYGSALSLTTNNKSVEASHFRSFHSPLKSQSDFINAFAAAHRIAEEISSATGTKVFPYSIFYVFFDQYAHIIAITQEILGLGLASVLLVTSFLLGSWRTGTIVTGVVALTVLSVMGVMGLWDISLNALSLVNLVISLGISVEFCAHIARAFMGAGVGYTGDNVITGQKERDERMWTALVDVGPSVLSGITFTKLIGISVMALTRSKLLEIYYFKMWFSLIISGALHGLVLLPVVLSLAGGPGYPLEDTDEEWMSNAIRRPDYEYTPFLTDDRSDESDS